MALGIKQFDTCLSTLSSGTILIPRTVSLCVLSLLGVLAGLSWPNAVWFSGLVFPCCSIVTMPLSPCPSCHHMRTYLLASAALLLLLPRFSLVAALLEKPTVTSLQL